MFDLNYADDIDGISKEANHLFRRGVIITKCYKTMKGTQLKVQTRLEFDETCNLVAWYISSRFGSRGYTVNIGDWVSRGELMFTFTEVN